MFFFGYPNNDNFGFSSALTAIVTGGLIYTFNGFPAVVAYASEIKNPGRNVPLAIILSLLIVLALYIGLQYAFMQAVPHEVFIIQRWLGWIRF